MRTVIETEVFIRQADAVWSIEERHAFIDWIALTPDAGEVIPHAQGARKVRWSRPGMGKRSGVRVIYFHLDADEVVLLVMLYKKAALSNVRPKDIKRSES